jgi:gliding motility-associated-like protein
MKTFYKSIVLSLLLIFAGNGAYAQLAATPYSVDMTVHYGTIGGIDLTGYVTYEVYVNFTTEDSYLLSIFGEEDPNTDCVFDTDTVTYFNFPCGLFQFESESEFGNTNNCLWSFNVPGFEAAEFDSYMTLGHECGADINVDIPVNIGFCPEWVQSFEGPFNGNNFDGGSFFWDGWAVSVAPAYDPVNSVSRAGSDLRVKIAQFTSCGGFNGCFNISYKEANQVGTNQSEYEYNICMEIPHPCIDFPLDTDPLVTNPACFGDDSEIVIADGGFGNVDYSLYSGTNITSGTLVSTYIDELTGLTLTGTDAGSYYYTMIDSVGCRDTSAVFTIVEPTELIFQPELVQGILCFGEQNAAIDLICSGGTAPVTITSNGSGNYACGDQLTDLSCGNYTLIATDANDCSVNSPINIVCPEELIIELSSSDIPCYNYDNGSITGTATGGTGLITAVLTFGPDVWETQTGTGTLIIDFQDLDGGDYQVAITDANGCGETFDFTIIEPAAVEVTATVTDVNCFNVCNGSVVFDIQGGTGPFDQVVTDPAGAVANPNALCDGLHNYTITDANGCDLNGEFEVLQPLEISYTVTPTGASCFAICDGQIEVTDVAGGLDGYEYTIVPNAGFCEAPCSGPSANYTNLCAGTYTINITDIAGCVKPITNIVVAGPAELIIQLNPTNVSCFGFADGQVVVTSTGGTGDVNMIPTNMALPTTITALAPGTYTYTIQDGNGCIDEEDVIITEPDLLVTTLTSTNDVSCGGACDGTLVYEVTGGTTPYAYELLPDGTTGAVNGTIGLLCAADYQLIVTDNNDCISNLDFTIAEPPLLNIDFNLNAPTCTGMTDGTAVVIVSGGTGALTAFIGPEDEFNLTDNGDGSFAIDSLGEGTVTVELIDEVGCIIEDEFEIIPDIITDMVLSTFSSPESCWNMLDGTATVAVQNGNLPISYLWNDSEEQITPTAIGLTSNEIYTVTVTDDIGCTLDAFVLVEPTIGCFFISTGITPNGDGSNDFWVIGGLEYFPDATVDVFNRWGQQVFSSKGYNNPWDGRLEGELLPVADYYFIIEYDKTKDPILGTVTIKY